MEIAGWANRCYIMTPHQKRRFPEKVDFQTSAGHCYQGRSRAEFGVRGGGPQVVVTNLGILEPAEDGELTLTAIHPGVAVEDVLANTGWPLKVAANLRITEAPKPEELRILREELDPNKIYLA